MIIPHNLGELGICQGRCEADILRRSSHRETGGDVLCASSITGPTKQNCALLEPANALAQAGSNWRPCERPRGLYCVEKNAKSILGEEEEEVK